MVSVIIPVYNEETRILETLKALYANTVQPGEVILSDGNSTDRTVTLVREHFSQVRIEANPRRHAAAGRNEGIKRAKGDILAFTDGDCLVAPDWIEQIEKAFAEHDIDGLGGKILNATPENHIEAYWGNLAWNVLMNFGDSPYVVEQYRLNDAFVTANCAYKRKLLIQLRGFSNWFANNAEDIDLCWRALKSGAKLMYIPSVQIYAHNVTTLQGVARKSFRNGVSSSKLQKRYGGRINYDPNIYKMLGHNLLGLVRREPDAGLNVMELTCHLAGKYCGSLKAHVINV